MKCEECGHSWDTPEGENHTIACRSYTAFPDKNQFAYHLAIAVVDLCTELQTSGVPYHEVIRKIYDLISLADNQREAQVNYMMRRMIETARVTVQPQVPRDPQQKP